MSAFGRFTSNCRQGFAQLRASRGLLAAQADAPPKQAPTGYGRGTLAFVAAGGLAAGIAVERKDQQVRGLVRPTGFRACCDSPLTAEQSQLPEKIKGIIGKANVAANVDLKGARIGRGTAMLVAKPGTLAEAIEVLKACVAADVAIIPQGANTALTGASVPRNDQCDRPTVVLNLRRLNKILTIGEKAEQVLCFSGAGIMDLQERLAKECHRDSHSVLGSIFLNPSVGAGVAFGSGGTQIRKGPAYSDRALFCKVLKSGEVELVNTLGLKDGGDVLSFLEGRSRLTDEDVDPACKAAASFPRYAENLTKFDGEVSRFNADTRGLDCNRSEGKVMILATVHDTYPVPSREQRMWVSCKDFGTAHAIKREVCMTSTKPMARTCEYFNREIYDATDSAGRLCVEVINLLGMKPIGFLWDIKRFVETLPVPFASIFPDKCMWWFNNLFPKTLPRPLQSLGDEFDHHLLIDFSEYTEGEVDALQALLDKFVASRPEGHVKYHTCQPGSETARANLFRFVMAIAFRVYCTGRGMQGLSIDYSLPKNFTDYPALPSQYPVAKRCVYSHFGCNVYHEDLVFGPEVDVEKAKHVIKHAIEAQGGRLPAEHGHGTEYHAPPAAVDRWVAMDPLNVMNPGVGCTSSNKGYAQCPCHLGHAHGHGMVLSPA